MLRSDAYLERTFRELIRCFFTSAGRSISNVTLGATTVTWTFPSVEVDGNYGVLATPNWNTTAYVSARSTTNATITFGTAAPANAIVSLMVFRV